MTKLTSHQCRTGRGALLDDVNSLTLRYKCVLSVLCTVMKLVSYLLTKSLI